MNTKSDVDGMDGPERGQAMKTLRLIRGWVCYRLVLLLPIRLSSPLYCWVLGWGGWYAHGGDGVEGKTNA